jgi:hypothetical protein
MTSMAQVSPAIHQQSDQHCLATRCWIPQQGQLVATGTYPVPPLMLLVAAGRVGHSLACTPDGRYLPITYDTVYGPTEVSITRPLAPRICCSMLGLATP